MDSFMSWIGGKKALRSEIVYRFPPSFGRYIEPFGGAGWVLFHKDKTEFEVYNDANSNLACLYNAVKYHPLAFMDELGFLNTNSRNEFNDMLKLMEDKWKFDYSHMDSELEVAKKYFEPMQIKELELFYEKEKNKENIKRAAIFYKLISLSYAAGCTSFSCQPLKKIKSAFGNVMRASKRLEHVIIENKDFEALIRQYDRDDALFYCDPPYFLTEKHYAVEFPKEDHERLRDTLKNIKGKFLLSYNDCEYIRSLYDGFYIEDITRINNISQRYEGGAMFAEVLISNYKKYSAQISLFNYDSVKEGV